jgi:diguanylate cyclase (GGDEF)-like protein
MNDRLKVLLVEDNPADARLIEEMLKDIGAMKLELEHAISLSQGVKKLSEEHFDALLLDLNLPDSRGGIWTLEQILAQTPDMPVIVLTGLDDETTGIRAMQEGAQDYLAKGSINGDALVRSIRYSVERKKLMVTLHNISLHDDLTGLYNRRGFFALAEQQMKVAKRDKKSLMIVVADLDGLKRINDSLGHSVGDMALKDAASVLKETIRESDVIGRIGGDEFAVAMMEEDLSGKDIVVIRLKETLKEHNEQKDRLFDLSLSIGIARCEPESVCSIDEMLSRADKLMYEDKSSKKKLSDR